MRENITGIRVIRSFNKQEYEKKRFSNENDFYRDQSAKLFKLMSCTEPSFFFLMNIATVIVYYLSCTLLNSNAVTLGNVVAFVEYLFHVMMSVLIFCMVFMMYPRANVSAKRIMEVLDTKPSIVNDKEVVWEHPFDHLVLVFYRFYPKYTQSHNRYGKEKAALHL